MAGVREGVGSYVFVFVCICILFVIGKLTVTRTREGVGSCLRIYICFLVGDDDQAEGGCGK